MVDLRHPAAQPRSTNQVSDAHAHLHDKSHLGLIFLVVDAVNQDWHIILCGARSWWFASCAKPRSHSNFRPLALNLEDQKVN